MEGAKYDRSALTLPRGGTMTDGSKPHDRIGQVQDLHELNPRSLVGSYFLSGLKTQWQGCVVAEPAPGVYLVELFSWTGGASTHQRIIRLEDMFDWRFFDTAEWMTGDYDRTTSTVWALANEEKRQAEKAAGPRR